MESCNEGNKKLTPIQEFYHDQNIFITGGTGFMGKLLIEKILRSCPSVKCIYILIRPKKGKDVLQRQNELFEDIVFSKLKEEQPKFRNRVVCIEGECTLPNLGITNLDKAILIEKISIVFHVAANTKFNEKIKLATAINVKSVNYMICLSREMPKLKSFVYVSTAYSQCPRNPIEEKFYDPPMEDDSLIHLVDCINEKLLDDIKPKLLGSWPNIYVYTKSVAENIVKKQAGLIPIGIFRPGVVISTYREPVRGWINNFYNPIAIVTGVVKGIIRTYYCNDSMKICLVPGDMTINALIVSAWDIANNRRSKEDIPIYNYVSDENPITKNEMKEMLQRQVHLTPTIDAIWYYSFRMTKNRMFYLFYVYILHLLPAFIMDIGMLCVAKKRRFVKMYGKLYKVLDEFNYFNLNEWNFTNERWKEVIKMLATEDRKLFFCDIKNVVWDTYFRDCALGLRLYLLKDPIETIPQARKNWRRLYWIHQAFKLVISCILFTIIWTFISKLLVTFE